MPPKPANSDTKHHRRCVVVRERVASVIGKIPPNGSENGLTVYGIFARRCAKIAVEHGSRWHKDGGSWAVKRFALGKQDAYGDMLDVMELACMEFEREFKELAQAASVIPIREDVHEEVAVAQSNTPDKPEEATSNYADPELDAMAASVCIFEPLDEGQRKRVLVYLSTRYEG